MLERDPHGPFDGQLLLFDENLTKQPAIHPFQHHIDAALFLVLIHLHDGGVVELFADLLFAAKTIEQERVGFRFGMRDLQGDGTAVAHILGAIDGGHAAARHQLFDLVIVELIVGMEESSEARVSGPALGPNRDLQNPQGQPLIFGRAFDHASAAKMSAATTMSAHIIATQKVIGKQRR